MDQHKQMQKSNDWNTDRIRTCGTRLSLVYSNVVHSIIVTKFGYLLYWDITGAPRHIPGQALFCVNIENGWNSVCNNCFNYSNLYWVKWVIWINSEFEFKYIRLIIRYWFCSTIHYLGDEIYLGARFECWRQAGSILLYWERGAWRVKLMLTGMSNIKVFL